MLLTTNGLHLFLVGQVLLHDDLAVEAAVEVAHLLHGRVTVGALRSREDRHRLKQKN